MYFSHTYYSCIAFLNECKENISPLCSLKISASSYRLFMCVYIFTHTQLETIKFVKHLQVMSSLHFSLGDAESVVNDL